MSVWILLSPAILRLMPAFPLGFVVSSPTSVAGKVTVFAILLKMGEILSIVVDWILGRLPGQAATSLTCFPFTNFVPASDKVDQSEPYQLPPTLFRLPAGLVDHRQRRLARPAALRLAVA